MVVPVLFYTGTSETSAKLPFAYNSFSVDCMFIQQLSVVPSRLSTSVKARHAPSPTARIHFHSSYFINKRLQMTLMRQLGNGC
jgi:hypothetical protein